MRTNWTCLFLCLIALLYAAPVTLCAAGFDGVYDGKTFASGYSHDTGTLRVVVHGGSVQGSIVDLGQFLNAEFSGAIDPGSGAFSASMKGRYGGLNFSGTLAGQINGNAASGTWSGAGGNGDNLTGRWSASMPAPAGQSKSHGQGDTAPQGTVGFDGEYSGSISSSDANAASGHIQFTVSGKSLHGTVGGNWAGVVVVDPADGQKQMIESPYSGTFSGPVDAAGNFSANLTGKLGEDSADSVADSFAGHIRGQIQGNDARGTWDAGNEWSKSSGTWHASRPQPVIPGYSSSSNDSTDIVNSPPPGITNVGDVPGPADLPQTGTSIVLPGLLAAASIGVKAMLDSRVTPPPVVDYGPAGPDSASPDSSDASTPEPESASDSTPYAAPVDSSSSATPEPRTAPDSTPAPAPVDSSSSVAPQPAPPTPDYGPDHTQAVQDWQDASTKYDAMKQQLADFEKTANPTDPQYDAQKQQYTDYLDYYKQKADYSSAQADAIAKAVEQDRNTKSLTDSQGNVVKQVVYDPKTGQWHDRETHNIFDPDKWQQVQDQAASDKAFNESERQKLADRQDAFSHDMDQLVQKEKQKEAEIAFVNRLSHDAMVQGLWNPGGPGNVYGKTQEVLDNITSGKPVAIPEIGAIYHVLHDRLSGASADESILTPPKATETTLQTLMTGHDEFGNISWTGVGLRLGAAVVTVGQSEAVYVPFNAYYSAKDAYANESTVLGSMWEGTKTAFWEAAPTLGGAAAFKYFPKAFPGVTEGVGEMLSSANKSLTGAAEGLGARLKQLVKGTEEAATRGSSALKVPAELQETRSSVDKVLQGLAAKDKTQGLRDLADLYNNDGMKRLAELQKAGALTKEEAKLLNAHLTAKVNEHIAGNLEQTIKEVQAETGDLAKVERVTVGDSGSSAKASGNPKAMTDNDRTVLVKVEKSSLENYAAKNGLTPEQADAKIQQIFADKLKKNVSGSLRKDAGFVNPEHDVGLSTYGGFGKTSGVKDAYTEGVTQTRAVTGKATEWTVTDGVPGKGRNIGGQTMVDQHCLDKQQLFGELPKDPAKFKPTEFRDYGQMQAKAINPLVEGAKTDVKSVAKAMGREANLADRMDRLAKSPYEGHVKSLQDAGLPAQPPKLDPKLAKTAADINANPDKAMEILKRDGFVDKNGLPDEVKFHAAVSRNIDDFNTAIGPAPAAKG